MEIQSYLKKITSAYGPSGDEKAISALLAAELEQYGAVTVDAMHNVSCALEGEGPHLLLDAHLDQIGLIVTDIDEQGFLKVARVGGIDRRALLAHEVTVWGTRPLPGVISCQPPHLLTAESEKKSVNIADISIDIGMSKAQAEACIAPGDRVTLKYQQCTLLHGRCSQSFADDRSGVAAILLALEKMKAMGNKRRITVLFSTQEEVGTRGAAVGAYGKGAQEAIVVDVSFAATPDSDPRKCGKLGEGPMIGISPILSAPLYQKLKSIAIRKNIPYQLEVMGDMTGTNADVVSVTQGGIPTALLSIPQRYMHTPVEMVSTVDIEQTATLIAAYAAEKGGVLDD